MEKRMEVNGSRGRGDNKSVMKIDGIALLNGNVYILESGSRCSMSGSRRT